MSTIVLKFGGASVATPQQFSRIADIIICMKQQYRRVVTVVSAMGNTTNDLITLAKTVNPHPPQREYDMLITVGERISMSLLAMALAAKDCDAMSFTGSQTGIITCDRHAEARIIDVRPHRLVSCLEEGKVGIVAGFQGVSRSKAEITTLGRGGSDTTAVALGIALKAEKVEFFKDVPGIFDSDPKTNSDAKLISEITYDEAITIIKAGAKVLHERCLHLAKMNGLPLYVRSFNDFALEQLSGTLVADSRIARRMNSSYEEGLC